eukprot:COSAG01_NODE_67203_length_267_cov_3.023810_1_plen_27_part_10
MCNYLFTPPSPRVHHFVTAAHVVRLGV